MESVPAIGDLMSTKPVVMLDDHNPPAVKTDAQNDSVGLRNHGLDHHNPPVLKPVALDEEHCPPVTMPSSSEILPPAIKDSKDPGELETTQTIGSNPPVPKLGSGILQQSEQNTPDTRTSDAYNLILKASNGNLQETTTIPSVTSPDHVVPKPTSPGQAIHEMRNPPTLQAAQNIGLAVVGDGGVGKSCLLITYMTGKFPQEAYSSYLAFGYYDQKVTTLPGGKRYTVQMYDAQGQEDYDRLRPLCYKDADVFLVCFSVVVPSSLENVAEKWIPEITHHCPKKPFLLVGTHTDLRSDTSTLNSLAKRKMKPVSVDEAKRRTRELRAVKYVECSTLTQEGLQNVFNEAILAASSGEQRSRRRCTLL